MSDKGLSGNPYISVYEDMGLLLTAVPPAPESADE